MGWIFAGFCLAVGVTLFYFCAPFLAGLAASLWQAATSRKFWLALAVVVGGLIGLWIVLALGLAGLDHLRSRNREGAAKNVPATVADAGGERNAVRGAPGPAPSVQRREPAAPFPSAVAGIAFGLKRLEVSELCRKARGEVTTEKTGLIKCSIQPVDLGFDCAPRAIFRDEVVSAISLALPDNPQKLSSACGRAQRMLHEKYGEPTRVVKLDAETKLKCSVFVDDRWIWDADGGHGADIILACSVCNILGGSKGRILYRPAAFNEKLAAEHEARTQDY